MIYKVFFWDNCTKFFLAQGDVILLTTLTDSKTQGLYSLLTNYGSLLLRIIFSPLEDSIRSYYSNNEEADQSIFDAVFILAQWSAYALFFYATTYIDKVIDILPVSSKLYDLKYGMAIFYCILLGCMILNGILEAYLYATSSVTQLFKLRRNGMIMSAIYFSLSFYLLKKEPSVNSILYANILNFSLRIVQSLFYIRQLPRFINLKCLTIVLSCLLLCMEGKFELEKAFGMAMISLGTVLYHERQYLKILKDVIWLK